MPEQQFTKGPKGRIAKGLPLALSVCAALVLVGLLAGCSLPSLGGSAATRVEGGRTGATHETRTEWRLKVTPRGGDSGQGTVESGQPEENGRLREGAGSRGAHIPPAAGSTPAPAIAGTGGTPVPPGGGMGPMGPMGRMRR